MSIEQSRLIPPEKTSFWSCFTCCVEEPESFMELDSESSSNAYGTMISTGDDDGEAVEREVEKASQEENPNSRPLSYQNEKEIKDPFHEKKMAYHKEQEDKRKKSLQQKYCTCEEVVSAPFVIDEGFHKEDLALFLVIEAVNHLWGRVFSEITPSTLHHIITKAIHHCRQRNTETVLQVLQNYENLRVVQLEQHLNRTLEESKRTYDSASDSEEESPNFLQELNQSINALKVHAISRRLNCIGAIFYKKAFNPRFYGILIQQSLEGKFIKGSRKRMQSNSTYYLFDPYHLKNLQADERVHEVCFLKFQLANKLCEKLQELEPPNSQIAAEYTIFPVEKTLKSGAAQDARK